jgi:hypothetical protein
MYLITTSASGLSTCIGIGVVLGRAPLPLSFVPEDRPAPVLGEECGNARRGVRGGEVGHAVLFAWRDEAAGRPAGALLLSMP